MKTDLTKHDVTPELTKAVYAYIVARAHAEVIQGEVDKVSRQLLAKNPLPNTAGHGDAWITNPHYTYLCGDEDALARYYDEKDKKLREAGLKPDDMPHDYCPALVARNKQVETEWKVIKLAGEMLEVDNPENLNNDLLCRPDGLSKRQQFIDLTARLVVTLNEGESP